MEYNPTAQTPRKLNIIIIIDSMKFHFIEICGQRPQAPKAPKAPCNHDEI